MQKLNEEAESAATFEGLLAKVLVPDAVVRSAEKQRELDDQVEAATTNVATMEEARKSLEQQVTKLPDLVGLKAAANDHRQLSAVQKKRTAAGTKLDEAIANQQAARQAAERASVEAAAATETLAQLRREHVAVDLAGHLVTGQPCPVCLQMVTVQPEHRRPAALTAAEHAVEKSTKVKSENDKILERTGKELASAQASVTGLVAQHDEITASLIAYPDPEALATTIEQVQGRHDALAKARLDEDNARSVQQKTQASADAARAKLTAAWQAFDTQRDRLVSLGPPTPERRDLLADWTALAEWASRERPRQQKATLDAKERAAAKAADHATALAGLIEACTTEGLDVLPDWTLAELRDEVVAAVGDAEHHLKMITDAIAEADRLRSQINEIQQEAVVADSLANHLRSTGFERWLVSEALDLLVDGASTTLLGLSSGQYSLTRDERNEFLVIDHRNADERRPAKTLSGGETFQASLALALALADQLAGLAAGGAAKLESIFLDEGFGTLDPETLATVADTIEALGSEERMVGIITHVRELAERVPVRFEVTKTARTSRVERQTS
jgi:exonuclease SbcC